LLDSILLLVVVVSRRVVVVIGAIWLLKGAIESGEIGILESEIVGSSKYPNNKGMKICIWKSDLFE
jgi:hypothetical protein